MTPPKLYGTAKEETNAMLRKALFRSRQENGGVPISEVAERIVFEFKKEEVEFLIKDLTRLNAEARID